MNSTNLGVVWDELSKAQLSNSKRVSWHNSIFQGKLTQSLHVNKPFSVSFFFQPIKTVILIYILKFKVKCLKFKIMNNFSKNQCVQNSIYSVSVEAFK